MPRRRANNEGTVFERAGRLRADGTREPKRWVAEITIDTPDGPKRKVIYAKSQAEAIQALEDAKVAKRQGRIGEITHQTVAEYLGEWIGTVRQSIRPSTLISYDLNLRRINKHLGHLQLAALKPADIQQWYGRMLQDGLSPATVGHARRVLHIALNDAVRWEVIPRNPIDWTKPPRVEAKAHSWLRPEEARDFFERSHDSPLHALWVVLGTAGLRIGEALGLTWDDFDAATKTLRIRRAVQRQPGKGLVFVDTKTEKSRRTIDLTEVATEALMNHHSRQDERRRLLGAEWHDNHLIFCGDLGTPLDATNVHHKLKAELSALGIRQVGLHELRHTAASLMLFAKVPMKVVQEILGHSSYNLTANTYSHMAPELQRDAARRLDSLFQAGEMGRELD